VWIENKQLIARNYLGSWFCNATAVRTARALPQQSCVGAEPPRLNRGSLVLDVSTIAVPCVFDVTLATDEAAAAYSTRSGGNSTSSGTSTGGLDTSRLTILRVLRVLRLVKLIRLVRASRLCA
jgi:hypothetical protein